MAKYVFLTRQQIDALVPAEKKAYLNRLQTDESFRTAYFLWYGKTAAKANDEERYENRPEGNSRNLEGQKHYGLFTHAETDMIVPIRESIASRDALIRKHLGHIKDNWLENHRLNTFTLLFSRVSTLMDYDDFDHQYGNGVKLKRGLDHYKSLIAKRDLQGVCDYITELKNMRDYIVKTPQLREQLKAELDNIDMIIKNTEEDRQNLTHVIMLEEDKKFLKKREKDLEIKSNYQRKLDAVYLNGGEIYVNGESLNVEPPLPNNRKARRAFKKANKGKEWAAKSHARLQQQNAENNERAANVSLGIFLASIGGVAALAMLTPLAPIISVGIGAAVTVVGAVASQWVKRRVQKRNEKEFAEKWQPIKNRQENSVNKSVCEDEYRTMWMQKHEQMILENPNLTPAEIDAMFKKDWKKHQADRVVDMPRNQQKFEAFKDYLLAEPELLAQFISHGKSKKAHKMLVEDIRKNPEAYKIYLPERDDTMPPEMALCYRDFAQTYTREQAVEMVGRANKDVIKGDPKAAFDKNAQDITKLNPSALKLSRYREPHTTLGVAVRHDLVKSVARSVQETASEYARKNAGSYSVPIATEYQIRKDAQEEKEESEPKEKIETPKEPKKKSKLNKAETAEIQENANKIREQLEAEGELTAEQINEHVNAYIEGEESKKEQEKKEEKNKKERERRAAKKAQKEAQEQVEVAPQKETTEAKGPEQTTPDSTLTPEELLGQQADAEYQKAEEARKKAEEERARAEEEETAKIEARVRELAEKGLSEDEIIATINNEVGANGSNSKDEGKEDASH